MSLLSHPLQAFMSIARQGTVHAAAKELGITQTGVTQRIRSLEKDLGITLFIRSRSGMKLSAEGNALLRYCKNVVELEGELSGHLSGKADQTTVSLSIAGPTSVMSSRIVKQTLPLYKDFPQLLLNFVIDDSENRVLLAKSAKADLIIIHPSEVPNEMDSKKLSSEKYLLVANPLWKKRKLSEIIKNEKLVDFDVNDRMSLNYLDKFGINNIGSRIFANNNECLIDLIIHGIAYGILSLENAQPLIDSAKVIALNSGAVYESPLALAWYPRPQMPLYFQSLLKLLR